MTEFEGMHKMTMTYLYCGPQCLHFFYYYLGGNLLFFNIIQKLFYLHSILGLNILC